MQVLLSAMSAGGLVGVTNQYAFLLALSAASRFNLIELGPSFNFMESWFFMGTVGVLWVLVVAPAYSTLVAPGIGNILDTISGFVHGFIIPASSALVAAAAVGVIANIDPSLQASLEAINLVHPEGNITPTGAAMMAGSSAIALTLNGAKAISKRSLGTAAGIEGTPTGPAFWATAESILSVVIVALFIWLSEVDPRLLIALLAVVSTIVVGAALYGLYLLYKLAKGVGKIFRLMETQPKAGWAIAVESLIWGAGAFVWDYNARGFTRLFFWVLWLLLLILGIPTLTTLMLGATAPVPPLLIVPPIIGTWLTVMLVMGGLYIGLRSSRSLMNLLEQDGHIVIPEEVKASKAKAAPASG